jgi:hypothetical protein
VPHLFIYSEKSKRPSLKGLPEKRTTVSKSLCSCLVLQPLCQFSEQNSSKISISSGHKGLSLCIIKLLFENNQKTHNTLRRLEKFPNVTIKIPSIFVCRRPDSLLTETNIVLYPSNNKHHSTAHDVPSQTAVYCVTAFYKTYKLNIKSVLNLDFSLYHKFLICY